MFEYGRKLARKRKGGDGDRLGQPCWSTRIPEDGQPLSSTDFDNYFLLLVVAGNETTRHTISQSMLALIENQDQLQLLQERARADPAGAVEEMLRWASPGLPLPPHGDPRRGDAAASRSRRATRSSCGSRPATATSRSSTTRIDFDVTRKDIAHVTFGKGSPHLCLGNMLARMEIRLMFEELFPRLPVDRADGEVSRVRSNFVNGIKTLPVRVSTV